MYELCLMCPEDRVESVSDALDALDALSVSVEDADAQTDAEQALFGEPGMPPPKLAWVVELSLEEALAAVTAATPPIPTTATNAPPAAIFCQGFHRDGPC